MDKEQKIKVIELAIEMLPTSKYICNSIKDADRRINQLDYHYGYFWVDDNFRDMLPIANALLPELIKSGATLYVEDRGDETLCFNGDCWFYLHEPDICARMRILEEYLKYLKNG